jgi:hypothetical protein
VCGGVDKSFFAVDFPDHLSDLSVFVGHGYDSRRGCGESSEKISIQIRKGCKRLVAAAGRGLLFERPIVGSPG